MKKLTFTLIVTISLSFAAPSHSAPKNENRISLADAVAIFNEKSLRDPIGATQPPVSVEEVVAAILLWERPDSAPISNELFKDFKSIAEERGLPENASFESLNGIDPGGSHVFDIWSVRIKMERPDNSTYEFVIRNRTIRSRLLTEELARLDELITDKKVETWVGGHRIVERRNSLKARIKKSLEQ